ncbi:MAG: tyrosine-type recombinase/integrase [Elusimicrobiota bacterium]
MARVFKKREEWWIDYRASGQRHREPVGASHTLAKEVLAKRLAEVAEQRHFPGRVANARTFNEVAATFWELHGKTLRSLSWSLMLEKIKTEFGSKKVGDISTADVQRFYNEIVSRRTSARANSALKKAGAIPPAEAKRLHDERMSRPTSATANRYLSLLRSIFNKAEAWGDFHGKNPCAGVKKGRESTSRLRYLSQDEMERLLSAAHSRLYPVVVCALLTGMRRGEILGLTWDNVSLEHDTLYIRMSKSGKPREIPIPSKLREVLAGLGPKPSGPLFDLPIIMLRRYFDKGLKEAGIFGFHFHDLRHTFASHFIMRTNDLTALQRLLGHSTPAMTLRYAHLSKGHMAANIQAFESAIPVKPQVPALSGHQGRHHVLPMPLLHA